MSGQTILVVDDDPEVVKLVTEELVGAGYRPLSAGAGNDALKQIYDKRPDLVILDINLPDSYMNGLTVCQRIREVSEMPIIMLTAVDDPGKVVEGLDAGADDYMTKPFYKEVLLARVRANLRRVAHLPQLERKGVAYSDGYLTVNLEERRVLKEGKHVKLSPTEFNLLIKLIEAAPRVVPYRDLLEGVWGYEYIDDIDYLRVYVWHLRRKLERDPKDPYYLINELGIGYRFQRQV